MNAFLFPGQGSQQVGMGADLFKSDATFQALVGHASDLTGTDLKTLCLRGPDRELTRTRKLQPLLTCVSLGYLGHLLKAGVTPQIVVGHSLGEIAALRAADVVTEEQAVAIASKRGALMETAAERSEGGMLAVIGLEPENGACLLEQAALLNVVLANDNAPDQRVFSGPRQALEELVRRVTRERLGRCVKLAVRGPWHHPFMVDAQTAFAQWLAAMPFKVPQVPVVLNTTATTTTDPEYIKAQLVANLTQPVRWRESMAQLRLQRCIHLFEVGPGRVLSGLARANGFANTVSIHCVNNLRGVAKAAAELWTQ